MPETSTTKDICADLPDFQAAAYRLVLDHSPIAMALVRPDGRIAMTNAPMDRLFGYGPVDLPGQPVEALVPRNVRARHPVLRQVMTQAPARRAMGQGRDLYGITRDGRPIPVEIGLDAFAVGAATWVLCSVIDISDRKAAERRLIEALNASASAMLLTAGDGTIVLVNKEACKLFRATEPDLVGRPVDALVPSPARVGHGALRAGYCAAPVPRAMGGGKVMNALRRDGSTVPVEIGLTPIHHDGETLVMATLTDVTRRQEHERCLQERADQLTHLNEELTRFTYSASHQLKAPISTMVGLLQLGLDDLATGQADEAAIAFREALETGLAGARMVESMTAMTRSGDARLHPEDIDLRALVHDCWTRIRTPHAVPARFAITITGPATFRSDRLGLQSILEALLSNADRFRADGPRPHRVGVLIDTTEGGLRLAVSDTGRGIEGIEQTRIFETFRTGHPDGGPGLGLALVARTLKRLGGSITVEASTAGSMFRLHLPMLEGDLPGEDQAGPT